jgi:hypothetical protein
VITVYVRTFCKENRKESRQYPRKGMYDMGLEKDNNFAVMIPKYLHNRLTMQQPKHPSTQASKHNYMHSSFPLSMLHASQQPFTIRLPPKEVSINIS